MININPNCALKNGKVINECISNGTMNVEITGDKSDNVLAGVINSLSINNNKSHSAYHTKLKKNGEVEINNKKINFIPYKNNFENKEEKVLYDIVKEIDRKNGKAFLVGGSVRDEILGKKPKDMDVEVFGLSVDKFTKILSKFGKLDLVGKSFGIFKIKGYDFDFSLPRRERKIGESHKDFAVFCDPKMNLKEAAGRRDFTINALMKNLVTGEIVDYYGGQKDLENKIIRHIKDETFVEDPLRVYRAAQFAARFGFEIHPDTLSLCKKMDLSSLPKERVFEEISKALLKADNPSIAFEVLNKIGIIEKYFPQLYNLINCPQPEKFHPEGDAWNHTMLVLDKAAQLKGESSYPLGFMLSALTHDIGKPAAFEIKDEIPTHHGHDKLGGPVSLDFLANITKDNKVLDYVSEMVENHMNPLHLYNNDVSDKSIKKFISNLNVDINDILLLSKVDIEGRAGEFEPTPIREWFRDRMDKMDFSEKPKPIVGGNDLIELGFKPGPEFRTILDFAFDLQLEDKDKDYIIGEIESKFK